jgi:hypothetical protein
LLAELHTNQLIELVNARRKKGARRARSSVPVMQYVRATLAALVPLALLAGVVWYGQQQRPIGAGLQGDPISHRPLEAARQDFARLRLQNAIEASRFLTGVWPETPSMPESLAPLGGSAMAPETARSYYYARREGGIVLLPPRR